MQTIIKSPHLKPHAATTDSSVGFENFIGSCHYGALLKGNGHLDVLRSVPDASGDCSGDPVHQASIRISNWDAVRTGPAVLMTMVIAPNSVAVTVSTGSYEDEKTGEAHYRGEAIPNVPLRFRLNVDCATQFEGDPKCSSDVDEVYKLKSVRATQIPW
jgi:hypothetical protein